MVPYVGTLAVLSLPGDSRSPLIREGESHGSPSHSTMGQPSVLLIVEVCRPCLTQLARCGFNDAAWKPCEACRMELDRYMRSYARKVSDLMEREAARA